MSERVKHAQFVDRTEDWVRSVYTAHTDDAVVVLGPTRRRR